MGALMWFWIEWRAYHDLPTMLVRPPKDCGTPAFPMYTLAPIPQTTKRTLTYPTRLDLQGFPENLLDEHH